MFLLGHIGVGRTIARRGTARHSFWVMTAGMLLPDIIDKPLYYLFASDVITCTRTFGHTGLLTAAMLLSGRWRRSNVLTGLGIGMATHLALDCLLDGRNWDGSAWRALTWPVSDFAYVYSPTVIAHLSRLIATPIIVSEVIGGLLLIAEWRRRSPHAQQPQAAGGHEE